MFFKLITAYICRISVVGSLPYIIKCLEVTVVVNWLNINKVELKY